MKYGYFNSYITDIGENVPAEVNELKEYADLIRLETLSSRPLLNDLIDHLQPGDKVYVHSFARFCSGLRDLTCLFTEIVTEKGADLISLHDDFDSSTEKGKIAMDVYERALKLNCADPIYGFYH